MLGQEKTRELLEQELERLRNENHRLKEELTSLKEKETNQSFKEKYAVRILESLPDMLTVFNHEGTGIGVVSSEETNHVGSGSCRDYYEALKGKDAVIFPLPLSRDNVSLNAPFAGE